ncbi:uncharacterized protein Z519_05409 [Cladophialophora bantiana CBS 173.52]|uniref:Cytochrome b561 domain-containing protein n=1 Tax=Cladophialophora bantiana (strain ATCC 10958 / CBS 173.52 / CDC B-1940 / NIH 8579) TaxID=1442370 RepID=A0A0D2HLD5_CLAB1|nr:uncharacterized protein Z519_05409 [Cladophialophora bantiana CBS 173.52]KIW94093.1 hypothetical protein Z519_05409 [Cladophialophora bantiana CBS 173.52]
MANMTLEFRHGEDIGRIPTTWFTSGDPIDSFIWGHVILMVTAFAVIFPIGMVLGLGKSRWHVPFQVFGLILTVVGWILPSFHGGRQYLKPNIHASFAKWLLCAVIAQAGSGIYLGFRLEGGQHRTIRKILQRWHGVAGKLMPVASWTQMMFGGETSQGFCHGDWLPMCAGHVSMGSIMVGTGIILVIITIDGERWIRKTGRSLDFYACGTIAASGCGNALFEHIPGSEWNHREYSHVAFGVFWWIAGIVGLWQTRKPDQRTPIPGVVFLVTGWYFSMHEQPNPMAKHVHEILGCVMMSAGAIHFMEIAYFIRNVDRSNATVDSSPHKSPNPSEFVFSFLIIVMGVINIYAPPQTLWLFNYWGLDHISLMLIWFSIAMGIMCFTLTLVQLYRSLKNSELQLIRGHGDLGIMEDTELCGLLGTDTEGGDEEEVKTTTDPSVRTL